MPRRNGERSPLQELNTKRLVDELRAKRQENDRGIRRSK